MIDVALPPIDRSGTSMGAVAEAFAMAYLSNYASEPVQTRPLQSYQRAWGFDNLKFAARVDGGRPGWLMALYTSGGSTHVIIAIERMTSIGQLVGIGATLNANQVGSLPGRVVSIFDDYATAIKAQLLADTDFIAATANRRYTMTITGFSLGAAVGEVLAAKLLAEDPTRQIRLEKFASPRVGNQTWLDGYDERIDKTSWYVSRDPIHTFPQTLFSRGVFPLATLQIYTFLERDAYPRPLDASLSTTANIEVLSTIDANLVLLSLGRPLTDSNLWFYHTRQWYRLIMQSFLRQRGMNVDYYRFAFLEHNDENSWQVNFRAGLGITSGMQEVLDPAPPVEVVPPSFYQRIADVAERVRRRPDGNQAQFGDNMEGENQAAGAWGLTNPARRIRRGGVVH